MSVCFKNPRPFRDSSPRIMDNQENRTRNFWGNFERNEIHFVSGTFPGANPVIALAENFSGPAPKARHCKLSADPDVIPPPCMRRIGGEMARNDRTHGLRQGSRTEGLKQ
jgi:hypothetical protein